jgi:hypothetical protein
MHYGTFIVSTIRSIFCPLDCAASPLHPFSSPALSLSLLSLSRTLLSFQLTSEHLFEPPQKLREELSKAKVPFDEFVTIKHGETRIISRKNEKGDSVALTQEDITYPLA